MGNPGYLERLLAVAGGALLIRKGLAVKGALGVADVLVGALALYRGLRPQQALPPAPYRLKHLPEAARRAPLATRAEPGRPSAVITPFRQPRR